MTNDKTHFGYREVAPEEKTRLVGEVFRSVAPKYDLMNDLMSLGVHRLWKRHFVATSGVRPGATVLDLAGCTGDIAARLANAVGDAGTVVLTDINPSMLAVGREGLGNLSNFAGEQTFDRRYQMLQELDGDNRGNSPLGNAVTDMDSFYQQSRAMMYNPEVDAVFRLTAAETVRYGVNNAQTGFGNACLTARNLLKSNLGTRAIQISIGGWDNHSNIYQANGGIYQPARQFDKGVGELLRDLASTPGINGGTLLDETLVVWMGEFGRTVRTANGAATPGLNGGAGRDHFFRV